MHTLRDSLIENALSWERAFGNAPAITSAISEFDAAMLVGLTPDQYSKAMTGMTSVHKGFDFQFNEKRYQVKANRPSGKPGSFVTIVPKASNYEWDFLIWLLYNPRYEVQEAWLWSVSDYIAAFDNIKRISPAHYRKGTRLK